VHDRFYIAAALREIGRLLTVKGEYPFRARAYERAASTLERTDADLENLIKERRLTEISGIGAGLAGVIEELYQTGQSSSLERLRQELPPGAIELSNVRGLSLKKIVALHDALGIKSVLDLKAACEKGLLRNVKGFGAKTETKILHALNNFEKGDDQTLLPQALSESERLVSYFRSNTAVLNVGVAGALRRSQEVVQTIKLVVASNDPQALLQHFYRFPPIAKVVKTNGNSCEARLATGPTAKVIIVAPDDYASSLLYFTGSRHHRAKLEAIATSKGFLLDAQGLCTKTGKRLRIKQEEEIYGRLGMQYVPAELREDQGEIEAARGGNLRPPVTIDEIQGLIHCHTVYSDGKNTIEEMALAADAMGMKYITITDHSPNAFYARGVKIDRLKAQWEDIARVQEKVKVKILKGTESDILDNGALDYPDAILERFDIIIASIHVRSGMGSGPMTQRLVRAMKSPFFKIWGHPLGRLLRSRPPLECDMDEVFDAIAASRAAIEVNGDPHRLDLEPRWIRAARRRGIRFVISTDAHSTESLRYVRYGVAMARRGWLTRDEILNTMKIEDFAKAVRPA
jgi:DNA polymerase (family 10)